MKAAIYCRLSEEDRNKANPGDDSESIQNQKNMLIRHAIGQGWDIFDIYSDDDYRGSDRNRPEFNRLLQDAQARKFQIVLCKTQSRFTRELELVEKYIHGRFPEWGIRFIGLVDNADTQVKGNKKSRQINGLVNEWYLEDLSESVSAALDSKRESGQYIGSFALYGYRKSETEKGRLVVDEAAAAVVRGIFKMYGEGYGFTAIAKKLNGEGIPNPTAYKAALGMKCAVKKRAGLKSAWSVNTVRGILRNGMYAGDLIQGRYEKVSYKSGKLRCVPKENWMITKSAHEPVINRDTWDATQLLLSRRTKMQKSGAVHLFAGMAYCGECGSALHSNVARGIKYLRCPAGEASKERCGGSAIQLREIERYVLEGVNGMALLYYDEQPLCKKVALDPTHEQECRALEAEKTRQEKELADMGRAALSLYLDRTKGSLADGEYETLSRELAAQRECAGKRMRALGERLAALREMLRARQTKESIIAKYRHFDRLDRELVCGLVERVEVGRRDSAEKAVPLRIVWKV